MKENSKGNPWENPWENLWGALRRILAKILRKSLLEFLKKILKKNIASQPTHKCTSAQVKKNNNLDPLSEVGLEAPKLATRFVNCAKRVVEENASFMSPKYLELALSALLI